MKLRQRLLTLGLGVTLTLSCFVVPADAAGYVDVPANAWYAQAVDYVQKKGLMDGTSTITFNPEGTMNRAMLAAALYRMAGEPAVSGRDPFSDTGTGPSHSDAITWAAEQGYISGYGDGRFGIGDPVTREQFATILWRYAGSPDAGPAPEFADEASISDYAQKAVDWARTNSIINGRENNLFAPRQTTTRAEAAVILHNYLTHAAEMSSVVKTTAGLVQGTAQNGVLRYLGLPYAQATERFVPAGAVQPWEGVRLADSYGKISPQGALYGEGSSGNQSGTDNNCQNLNLWTPGADNAKRPVMVWLHGGGFSTGSGNDPGCDGANLSRAGDVVVVTVNHRLNVFGYLDLSEYGDKYQYSANVGMTDIIAALEWVHDNIAAFGGDPDNVTVFGQSGGGAKVLALMTSPYAKGLFHKGIVQSGATERMDLTFSSKEVSASLTRRILNSLNITADNIEDLQTVPAARLQEAANAALHATAEEYHISAAQREGYAMGWGPVVDGDFLPTNPVTEDSFAEAGKDIPLLIGSTLNEWNYFSGQEVESIPTPAEASALREAYPNKPNLKASQVDILIRLSMLKVMSHKADQGGANVYAYVFARNNSFHGAEIPFVFRHTGDYLEERVSAAWVNFARTGVPDVDGLPKWEAYTRAKGATMLLDDESKLVYHHDQKLMKLLAPDYEY